MSETYPDKIMNEAESVEQYKLLHQVDQNYGASSAKFIDEIAVFIEWLNPSRVLDYGCGKGALISALSARYPGIEFLGFDPAVPGRETLPQGRFDLVINTDVLEHIPEASLPTVIETISKLTDHAYFNLHHALAKTVLPNGQNAHCTVKPPEWYHTLMRRYFASVTPLKGRRAYLSVVITFPIPAAVSERYLHVLERVARRPWWKRMLRELVGKRD